MDEGLTEPAFHVRNNAWLGKIQISWVLNPWCYLWFTIVRFLLRRWRDEDRLGRLNRSAALCVLLAFFVLSMTEAVTAARLHAGLRMNLTVALLVIVGIRLAACARREDTLPLPKPARP